MDEIKTSTNQNLLFNKGILLKTGEICKDKINLISGAMTAPLIETIWTFLEHDTEAVKRILTTLSHLYQKGYEAEMMATIHILYDLSGLNFPEDVEMLKNHPEAKRYFLFSFLLDMDECMQNFIVEPLTYL